MYTLNLQDYPTNHSNILGFVQRLGNECVDLMLVHYVLTVQENTWLATKEAEG